MELTKSTSRHSGSGRSGEEVFQSGTATAQVRDFLDGYEHAVARGDESRRTANKARGNPCAIMSWAWEQDIIGARCRVSRRRGTNATSRDDIIWQRQKSMPSNLRHTKCRNAREVGNFPSQWDGTGGVRLSSSSITESTRGPFGSRNQFTKHLWRHVSWEPESPNRQVKEQSRWGWIFYRRVKTGKTFYRPMNRTVHSHIKSIMPEDPTIQSLSAVDRVPTFVSGSFAIWLASSPRRMSRPAKSNRGFSRISEKHVRPTTTSTSQSRRSRSSAILSPA